MKKSVHNAEHYNWGENCHGWHLLDSGSLSVISEKMPAGASEELHYHANSQQVFYILSGQATFETDGEIVCVSAHESLHIPSRTWHRVRNKSKGNLTFLVVSEPKVQGDRIELVGYSDEMKEHIKSLNYEWLEKYFRVEESDARSLANPTEEIVDKGGFIWFARFRGQIVGTVSLLKKPSGDFEIAKMAVSGNFHGLGIGSMLLKHCVDVARQLGIEKLVLYSNTKLENAIHLYRKFGFAETDLEPGLYERANIKMMKVLK